MELNNDWVNINLGKSALLKARIGWQGLTTAEYLNSGDYFLVTGTDFLNGYIDWKNCVYVEKERYDQDKYIQLQVDDILVTKDGTIGKVAIIDKIIKPTTLNSGVFVVRPIKNSFYPKYLFYILRSGHFSDFLSKLTAGSTINHLYQKDFVYYTFPAPPTIEEQKQIANTLSDTDQLIQNLKTLITKKKAIKQGAMQELLTGKKRLQGFTEEWETKKLGEVAFIKTGSKNNQDKVSDGNFPFFVRSQSVERINTYSYDCEAILVPGEGGIGSIFHYINGKFDVHQRVYVINDFSKNVFGKYVYLFMKEHFGTHAMKNSVKATVDSLRLPTFQEFEIKIPKDIQEQQAIAQILSDMDAEIEALEQQLQKTQALKQGMMQELLTGKIRLVKPATQEKPKPLTMVAEPEVVYKKETKPKRHNEHFNDAVLIGTMANAFGSEKFPLTRFMYTKVSYLLKRYKQEQDAGYLKKAAGPYKPKTRYGGAEKIAFNNNYIKKHISSKNGKKYENFLAGENISEAISYFIDWYGETALNWIQQFKYTKRSRLELWATVDMAIEDLKQENRPVNFQTIKELINNHKEWRPKLKRSVFSDDNIKTAINKINQLFG